MLTAISDLGERVGRFSIRSITADYARGRSGENDYVLVKLDMDFYGDTAVDATRNYRNLVNAVKEELWCDEFESKSTREFDGGGGIFIDGMTIRVDVSKYLEANEGEQSS